MDFTKYPQYHLYCFTKSINKKRAELIPKGCEPHCVDSTIINRAYYSAYLLAELWLRDNFNFKPKHYWEWENTEEFVSEHSQIISALYKYDKKFSSNNLYKLKILRHKADYEPFGVLTKNDIVESLEDMEFIFKDLKFD